MLSKWLAVAGNLISVVGPRAKLHQTTLFIERKPLDVHFTTRFVNGWWIPANDACVIDCSFRQQRHFVVAIRTVLIIEWIDQTIELGNNNKGSSIDWLVVEDDIGQPDVLSWNVEHLDVLVISWVPHQTIIDPFLFQPHGSGHHLIPQTLKLQREYKLQLQFSKDPVEKSKL